MGSLELSLLNGWRRAAVFCFYVGLMTALAELGAAMSHKDLGFSTLWPPCGLFFAALTFSENTKRDWFEIFLASAIANYLTDTVIHGGEILITLGFILSNTFSSMSAAWIARKFIGPPHALTRLKDMFVFLACGLIILAPLNASLGLWLQHLFGNRSFSMIKWAAWWSSNALGVASFGILSLYLLHVFAGMVWPPTRLKHTDLKNMHEFGGRRSELLALWIVLLFVTMMVQFAFIGPWGLFVVNILLLIWAFRFGVLQSSIALAFTCILRISHALSTWEYMTPFAEILFVEPKLSAQDIQLGTVISVQLFLIERSVLINIASALFADLHRKQKELMSAADSRERLMARMSHEIRTPLGGVLGLIEAWAMKEKTEQRARELQMILNSGAQLKRVIDDVLDFSKLSAGKMKLESGVCKMTDFFHEVISLHSAEAQRKGLSLELNLSERLVDEILIDAHRLRQIVNNLVANAVKFTAQGYVRIHVESLPRWDNLRPRLRVIVEDSGIGISNAAMKNLFQPFEQEGSETTRAYGGTGLGLAICRELTELLQGEIHVESTRGVGSRFILEIPYDDLAHRVSARIEKSTFVQEKPESQVPAKSSKVLIVEDDPINQVVASRFLEAEGYTVEVVDNGAAALEILNSDNAQFDLVLMDYFMPSMDGCEVTRRYRQAELQQGAGHHLPIVALTASILPADHLRCRQAGMDDVLLKPIERKSLREILKKYTAA